MVSNAEHQREILNQAGLEMLELCKSQLEKAIEAFLNNDSDLAEEVMSSENRVNALDIKIEKDCEKFLALYNPVAIDLRFIMAVLKINFALERIGDHAYSISRYVVDRNKKISEPLLKSLEFDLMVETVFSMIENITLAYETKDAKTARKVFKKDKILDKIDFNSFDILEDEIKKEASLVGEALILSSVIKKMERVGDLIKNVGEEIIFYIDAEVLKHKKKK
jgi:phosphate transport system protein